MPFIDFEAVVKVCIAAVFISAALGLIFTWAFKAEIPAPVDHRYLAATWFPALKILATSTMAKTDVGFVIIDTGEVVTMTYDGRAILTFSETEGVVFDVPLANVFAEFCSDGKLPLIEEVEPCQEKHFSNS